MYYKLTDQNMQTYNGFQWELGKWYRIPDTDRGHKELCTNSWFHVYNSPILAILLNPMHTSFENPRLFRVNVAGRKLDEDGTKQGFTMVRLIEELSVPEVTLIQRVIFGILCGKKVYQESNWQTWANNWLTGKDRTFSTARAVAYTVRAATYAAVDAAAATKTLVDTACAAACATYAAANTAAAADAAAVQAATYAAVDAAAAAADAAYAAAYAVKNRRLNLKKLAREAMKVKE